MRVRSVLASAFVLIFSTVALAGPWEVVKDESGLVVKKDGQVVTHYLIKAGNKPILWPIIGPTGKEMTRAYPMRKVEGEKTDHIHQRSLWFTHGDVNGTSFWEEVNPKHQPGETVHREFVKAEGGDQATIVVRDDWKTPEGKKLLEDERKIVIRDVGEARVLDFDVTLKATEGDVKFGETKEGAFGIRVPTSMDVNSKKGGQIVTSEGDKDDSAWGKKAAWVDYHGPVDGEQLGIAVLNHPSSFRFPTRWHVRTYGLFAANPWGTKDFTGGKETGGEYVLPKGESLNLRYRVIFHKGNEQEGKIAEAFAKYAEERK
jgi:hypothetical protein